MRIESRAKPKYCKNDTTAANTRIKQIREDEKLRLAVPKDCLPENNYTAPRAGRATHSLTAIVCGDPEEWRSALAKYKIPGNDFSGLEITKPNYKGRSGR